MGYELEKLKNQYGVSNETLTYGGTYFPAPLKSGYTAADLSAYNQQLDKYNEDQRIWNEYKNVYQNRLQNTNLYTPARNREVLQGLIYSDADLNLKPPKRNTISNLAPEIETMPNLISKYAKASNGAIVPDSTFTPTFVATPDRSLITESNRTTINPVTGRSTSLRAKGGKISLKQLKAKYATGGGADVALLGTAHSTTPVEPTVAGTVDSDNLFKQGIALLQTIPEKEYGSISNMTQASREKYAQAAALWKRAAEAGNGEAASGYGAMLMMGADSPTTYGKATTAQKQEGAAWTQYGYKLGYIPASGNLTSFGVQLNADQYKQAMQKGESMYNDFKSKAVPVNPYPNEDASGTAATAVTPAQRTSIVSSPPPSPTVVTPIGGTTVTPSFNTPTLGSNTAAAINPVAPISSITSNLAAPTIKPPSSVPTLGTGTATNASPFMTPKPGIGNLGGYTVKPASYMYNLGSSSPVPASVVNTIPTAINVNLAAPKTNETAPKLNSQTAPTLSDEINPINNKIFSGLTTGQMSVANIPNNFLQDLYTDYTESAGYAHGGSVHELHNKYASGGAARPNEDGSLYQVWSADSDKQKGDAALSTQDWESAVQSWAKAANRGNANAIDSLAGAYWMGKGVPQDKVKAAAFYLTAENMGYGRGSTTPNSNYDWLTKSMTQEQIDQAKALASEIQDPTKAAGSFSSIQTSSQFAAAEKAKADAAAKAEADRLSAIQLQKQLDAINQQKIDFQNAENERIKHINLTKPDTPNANAPSIGGNTNSQLTNQINPTPLDNPVVSGIRNLDTGKMNVPTAPVNPLLDMYSNYLEANQNVKANRAQQNYDADLNNYIRSLQQLGTYSEDKVNQWKQINKLGYGKYKYAKGGKVKTRYAEGDVIDTDNNLDTPSGAETLQTIISKYFGQQTEPADIKAARDQAAADTKAFNDSLTAATANQYKPDKSEMYWRIASAFFTPTKTGNFGDSLANVGAAMAEYKKDEREAQQAQNLRNLQLQLEGQKLKMQSSKEDLTTQLSLYKQDQSDRRALLSKLLEQEISSGKPQSEAGKQAADEGFTPGTSEYNLRVKAIYDQKITATADALNAKLENYQSANALRDAELAGLLKKQTQLSPGELKLKDESRALLTSYDQSLGLLAKAYELNKNAFGGTKAEWAQRTLLEQTGSKDPKLLNTKELENLLGLETVGQLKATFGGAFTAAEGAKLEALKGLNAKTTEERRRILMDAYQLLKQKKEREQQHFNDISQGLYSQISTPDLQ